MGLEPRLTSATTALLEQYETTRDRLKAELHLLEAAIQAMRPLVMDDVPTPHSRPRATRSTPLPRDTSAASVNAERAPENAAKTPTKARDSKSSSDLSARDLVRAALEMGAASSVDDVVKRIASSGVTLGRSTVHRYLKAGEEQNLYEHKVDGWSLVPEAKKATPAVTSSQMPGS